MAAPRERIQRIEKRPTAQERSRLPEELSDALGEMYHSDPQTRREATSRIADKIIEPNYYADSKTRLSRHMDVLAPHLIRVMHSDPEAQRVISWVLTGFTDVMQPHARQLTVQLGRMLKGPDPANRSAALSAIKYLARLKGNRTSMGALVPMIAREINGENPKEAGEALFAIAKRRPELIRAHGKKLLPELQKGIHKISFHAWQGCVESLKIMGPHTLPDLVASLSNRITNNHLSDTWGEAVKQTAQWLREGHHPELRPAVVELFKEISEDRDSQHKTAGTMEALSQLQGTDAIPFLSRILEKEWSNPNRNTERHTAAATYRRHLYEALSRFESSAIEVLVRGAQKERASDLKRFLAQEIATQYKKRDATLETHFDAAIRTLGPWLTDERSVQKSAQEALETIRRGWAHEFGQRHEPLLFAMGHINPQTHPKTFMTVWEDRQDAEYAGWSKREWELHVKHLKSDETALKAA